jgi:DNA-binding response OmpR family regulator
MNTIKNKPYLFIVDDEPSLRLLLTEYLKPIYEIVTLSSAEEALEGLKLSEPKLMIVDLNMEGMSGLELIRQLRNQAKWKQLPILVLSSNDSSSHRIEALRAGADDYMIKPFNPEELEVRLEVISKRLA